MVTSIFVLLDILSDNSRLTTINNTIVIDKNESKI